MSAYRWLPNDPLLAAEEIQTFDSKNKERLVGPRIQHRTAAHLSTVGEGGAKVHSPAMRLSLPLLSLVL